MAVVLTNYTLGDVKTEVRTLIGDAESLSLSWSNESVNAAINWAVEHYFRITGKSYTEAELTKSGTTFPLPNSYIYVKRAGYNPSGGTNTWLLQSTIDQETNKNPDWQTLVGTPKRWVLFDGNKLRLTPNPSTGTCVIGYAEEPMTMADERTITAITQASSGVVTSANHNFSVGRKVQFVGITTMIQLNNQIGTITATTTNTFTVDITTTSYTAFGSGTGYAADPIDTRIPVPYQRFLKYAAASWLLQIDGDTQDMQTAANYLAMFSEIIKDDIL